MALTLAQLYARLDLLKAARYSPTRNVKFENGTEVTYSSDRELASAIAALEAEIAGLEGTAAPRSFRVALGNGLS